MLPAGWKIHLTVGWKDYLPEGWNGSLPGGWLLLRLFEVEPVWLLGVGPVTEQVVVPAMCTVHS